MNQATFSDRLREFFTLRGAERDARALSESKRAAAAHELSLAFQKREAAETLWPRGCGAEALRLARESLDLASAALDNFAADDEDGPAAPDSPPIPSAPNPPWLAPARSNAEDARKKADAVSLPQLEADVSAGDEQVFRAMISAGLAIEETLGFGLADPQDIVATRRSRMVMTATVVLLALIFFAWWLHTPLTLHATASTQSGNFSAENAVDGNPKTFWVLPDKQTGWLDLTLGGAHTVHTLRVVSANPPYNDRAAKDAHIEAFADNKLVKATDVTFRDPVGADPDWNEVPLGVKCDRIRITVKSFYGPAASIGEVEVR